MNPLLKYIFIIGALLSVSFAKEADYGDVDDESDETDSNALSAELKIFGSNQPLMNADDNPKYHEELDGFIEKIFSNKKNASRFGQIWFGFDKPNVDLVVRDLDKAKSTPSTPNSNDRFKGKITKKSTTTTTARMLAKMNPALKSKQYQPNLPNPYRFNPVIKQKDSNKQENRKGENIGKTAPKLEPKVVIKQKL